VVLVQTGSQTRAGMIFSIGVYIGKIGWWIVIGTFAIGLTISFVRHLATEKRKRW
jgi:hypothetical protein